MIGTEYQKVKETQKNKKMYGEIVKHLRLDRRPARDGPEETQSQPIVLYGATVCDTPMGVSQTDGCRKWVLYCRNVSYRRFY
jgi:hypothetical protein